MKKQLRRILVISLILGLVSGSIVLAEADAASAIIEDLAAAEENMLYGNALTNERDGKTYLMNHIGFDMKSGSNGSVITYTSSDSNLVDENGKINRGNADKEVTVTIKAELSGETQTKECKLVVPGRYSKFGENEIVVGKEEFSANIEWKEEQTLTNPTYQDGVITFEQQNGYASAWNKDTGAALAYTSNISVNFVQRFTLSTTSSSFNVWFTDDWGSQKYKLQKRDSVLSFVVNTVEGELTEIAQTDWDGSSAEFLIYTDFTNQKVSVWMNGEEWVWEADFSCMHGTSARKYLKRVFFNSKTTTAYGDANGTTVVKDISAAAADKSNWGTALVHGERIPAPNTIVPNNNQVYTVGDTVNNDKISYNSDGSGEKGFTKTYSAPQTGKFTLRLDLKSEALYFRVILLDSEWNKIAQIIQVANSLKVYSYKTQQYYTYMLNGAAFNPINKRMAIDVVMDTAEGAMDVYVNGNEFLSSVGITARNLKMLAFNNISGSFEGNYYFGSGLTTVYNTDLYRVIDKAAISEIMFMEELRGKDASVTVVNTGAENKPVSILYAVYNAQGTLKDICIMPVVLDPDFHKEYALSVDNYQPGDRTRLFMVDGLDSLRPIDAKAFPN